MNYRLLNDLIFRDFVHHVFSIRAEGQNLKKGEQGKLIALRCWMDLIKKYPAEEIDAAIDLEIARPLRQASSNI
jgi:hypothetical protein